MFLEFINNILYLLYFKKYILCYLEYSIISITLNIKNKNNNYKIMRQVGLYKSF